VSGDTGCDDPALVDNAVHFRAIPPGETNAVDVYLFTFRNDAAWQASAPRIRTCRGDATGTLSVSPYHAYGNGWSDGFHRLVTDALNAASGGRRPSPPTAS
jgi:hypothetical protein